MSFSRRSRYWDRLSTAGSAPELAAPALPAAAAPPSVAAARDTPTAPRSATAAAKIAAVGVLRLMASLALDVLLGVFVELHFAHGTAEVVVLALVGGVEGVGRH